MTALEVLQADQFNFRFENQYQFILPSPSSEEVIFRQTFRQTFRQQKAGLCFVNDAESKDRSIMRKKTFSPSVQRLAART